MDMFHHGVLDQHILAAGHIDNSAVITDTSDYGIAFFFKFFYFLNKSVFRNFHDGKR